MMETGFETVFKRGGLTEETREHVRAWIAALRSGEYKQGLHRLKMGDRFCCLGVACDVYAKATGQGGWESAFQSLDQTVSGFVLWEFRDLSIMLPAICDWYGVTYSVGQSVLTRANDSEDVSFDGIADLLERDLANA